jgi:glutathione synthase/RimK-type ligase-like ATP-grasp enzyme
MILIITHKDDYTADYVINKLNKSGIPYFRFNCEDYLDYNISVSFDPHPGVTINGFSDFSSVWYRRTKLPDINAANQSEYLFLLGEIDTFLTNLFGIVKGKWLSNPSNVHIAENKMLQLTLANEIGFDIPATLITSDKGKLASFIGNNKKTIIKPLGRGRIDYPDSSSRLIFTNVVSDETISSIDQLILTPAIFQELLDKEYEIRTTIVGKEIFSAIIDSQANEESKIDWRRSTLKFEKYELPPNINEMCFELINKLGISFGALDFVKTKSEKYVFLEINPNGQWVWIEKDTGHSISKAIINFLS